MDKDFKYILERFNTSIEDALVVQVGHARALHLPPDALLHLHIQHHYLQCSIGFRV